MPAINERWNKPTRREQAMYGILKSRLEGMKGEATEFARELVRTKSVSLGEEPAAALVERKMRELGFQRVLREECGNVVGAMLGRRADTTLALISHLDTVAPRTADADPWSGRLEGGRLYGVGAADCKAGLAAQVYAAYLLQYSLLPLQDNLVVAAAVAEENGLSVGVRGLLERTLPELGLRPRFAVLGEPTGLDLYYGHDGWMELDIQVEGPNPFHVDDITRHIAGDLRQSVNADQASGAEYELAPVARQDAGGVCQAGLRLARRLHHHGEEAQVLQQVTHCAQQVAQQAAAVGVSVQVRRETQRLYNGKTTVARRLVSAWSTDPFDPLIERARQALAAAGCEGRPGKWQLGRLGMGTAGSVLVNEFQVPTIGYGPGLEAQAHAAGEYVEVDKLHAAIYGTAAIAHGLVGIPVCGWTADEI